MQQSNEKRVFQTAVDSLPIAVVMVIFRRCDSATASSNPVERIFGICYEQSMMTTMHETAGV